MPTIHRLGAPSVSGSDPTTGGSPGDSDPANSGAGAALPTFFPGDVLILAGGPGWGRTVAEDALRSGARLWLDEPASWGLSDFRALLALAEESGVEVAVSRPWRTVCRWPGDRYRLVRIDAGFTDDFPAVLGAAIDLATWLSGTHVLQRVDAEKIADSSDRVNALLATIRFQNGAMAQLSLVGGALDPRTTPVQAVVPQPEQALVQTPVQTPVQASPLAPSFRVAGGNESGWHELGTFEVGAARDGEILDQFCAVGRDFYSNPRIAHLADAISARVIKEKLYAVLRGV